METMEQDLHYIGKMAGVVFEQEEVVHKSSGGSTAQLTRKYFSQLDNEVVEQLYKLYQLDFEMFGYSTHPFINQ